MEKGAFQSTINQKLINNGDQKGIEKEMDFLIQENLRLHSEIESIYKSFYSSYSWKITYPIRLFFVFLSTLILKVKYCYEEHSIQIQYFIKSLYYNYLLKNRKNIIYLDISDLILKDNKTGIQRVTRSIINELFKKDLKKYDIKLVYADTKQIGYRFASRFQSDLLILDSINIDNFIHPFKGDIFIGLDLKHEVTIFQKPYLDLLYKNGVAIWYVVYDLLPIQFPQYWPVQDKVDGIHQKWLSVISQYTGVLCISKAVSNEYRKWLQLNQIKNHLKIHWFHLGADIENSLPSFGIPKASKSDLKKIAKSVSFIMVGTLEPRKGHMLILDTFELLWKQGYQINLVIVGKIGWLVDPLIKKIETNQYRERIFWYRSASDEFLNELYCNVNCLIAASEGEGFGLPLIEAAQHNLPIICRNIPVFKEIAKKNAFYFKETKANLLADKFKEWLILYENNAHPKSNAIKYNKWKDSAEQILNSVLFEK